MYKNTTRLAQGHFDTRTGGAGVRTANLEINGRAALPPEQQPPHQKVGCRCGVGGRQYF